MRVQREATEGKPAGRDAELERVILKRLGAHPDDRLPARPQSGTSTQAKDVPGNVRTENMQKEVDELREKVKALEKRLSDLEEKKLR